MYCSVRAKVQENGFPGHGKGRSAINLIKIPLEFPRKISIETENKMDGLKSGLNAMVLVVHVMVIVEKKSDTAHPKHPLEIGHASCLANF